LGKKALAELATVAKAETILAWNRQYADRQIDTSALLQSVGRPRVDKEIEDLVIRIARENRSWGCDRIVGALINLGYRISAQTVGNILKRHSIPPAPERKKTVTWREFVHIHMDLLTATDFFTAAVWSWWRLIAAVLLFNTPFGHCKVQIGGIVAALKTRWTVWHVDVERWVHWVREKVRSRLRQLRTPVQRPLLGECAPYSAHKRLPQGMGNVRVLPVLEHRLIRDGPLRKPAGLGGRLQNDDRAAA
jgi:hypothetical protein